MIFTVNRRFVKPTEQQVQYIESPKMTFSNKYRGYLLQKSLQTKQIQEHSPAKLPSSENHSIPTLTFRSGIAQKQKEANPAPIDPKKKPMKWGEPTWFLFHTLAEKIKPEYYADIRIELLNLIYTVCSNLPCPTCAKHATDYLNAMNFNSLLTKESLQIMLYNFHNEVNRRKGFSEFPFDQLTAKYSTANTVNIIHNFMPYFEDKVGGMRLIADNLHRSRVALQLRAWFNKNIGNFDL